MKKKENEKKYKKNINTDNGRLIIFITAITFIFFLIVGFFITHTGDDWGNTLITGGISGYFKSAVSFYQTFEGRFFSRIFVLIMNNSKILWMFSSSLIMALICFVVIKTIKKACLFYPFCLLL